VVGVTPVPGGADATSLTVTGLTNGATYTIAIRASNGPIGYGAATPVLVTPKAPG